MFILSLLNVDCAFTDFTNVEKLLAVVSERSAEMSGAEGKLNLSLTEPRKWLDCRRCVSFRLMITHPVVCQPHKYFMSCYHGLKKDGFHRSKAEITAIHQRLWSQNALTMTTSSGAAAAASSVCDFYSFKCNLVLL